MKKINYIAILTMSTLTLMFSACSSHESNLQIDNSQSYQRANIAADKAFKELDRDTK